MATNGTSPPKVQRNLKGFTTVLRTAACEWFLIFLLFVDAILSYLLTRFAHYCELQIPCILCSRLDHIFGNEKPGFYRNLLCTNHRSEISSLISCNIHGKLVDGRGMCEICLSSHSEENKSNSGMQRLFLGKLGFDLTGCGNCSSWSSYFNQDLTPASKGTRLCLCCNKPWIPRPNAQRLLALKSPRIVVSKPNIPFPRRLSRRNGLKKIRDKFSAPAASHLLGKTGFDPLSHVGYTELGITSGSESEVPISDDENGNSIVCDINENRNESVVLSAPEAPAKRLSNILATTKEPDANEPRDVRCLASDVPGENDVCEYKEQLADQKTNPPVMPELISLDDIPPSSCVVEVPSFSASLLSDLISLVDAPLSVDVTEVPLEASSEKSSENISINKNDEILKLISTSTVSGFRTDQVVADTAMVNSTDGDLSAVHKSPVCGEERDTSGFVMEEPMLTYNNGVNEDLKSLPVQNSSGQGIDLSLNNLSPRLRGHSIELQRTNESNSDEAHNHQNPVFMERSEFAGLESFDGSNVNEIEGENLVDRLKRQVAYDRKCMNALNRELEEERSASAIAANQAMAMITRLQEEKAALHMEALQYLRMMEEQAEYDVDALEKANDLLAEKEKELQDLEAELEYYRLNFPDETLVETVPEASIKLKEQHVSVENTSTSFLKDDLKFPSKTMFHEASEVNNNLAVISAWSEFEDEKLYISHCLQNLESKLKRFAHHGNSPCISDGEYFDEAADGGQHQQEFLDEMDKQAPCQVEGNDLSVQKASSVSNGSAPSQEGLNTSISRDQVVSEGNSHMVSNGQKDSMDCRETGLAALENEISDLNERLEALEADCNFLEHSLNSLGNGNEGMLFIQEILHHLRELRKLGIRSRNMSVS
ncbi:probable myosin-binding protein 4 isoform X2 [Herrania umbratica]|uniref:Probable myosin-binding protein 4 isoform X2 n=1 Tax=Herrania umbratica TaxID=108875 RepID=A0A6J0ZY23_9ROSI|nr:probable myosin-binding protein 4 isoform X2 [Herrania umbratica]